LRCTAGPRRVILSSAPPHAPAESAACRSTRHGRNPTMRPKSASVLPPGRTRRPEPPRGGFCTSSIATLSVEAHERSPQRCSLSMPTHFGSIVSVTAPRRFARSGPLMRPSWLRAREPLPWTLSDRCICWFRHALTLATSHGTFASRVERFGTVTARRGCEKGPPSTSGQAEEDRLYPARGCSRIRAADPARLQVRCRRVQQQPPAAAVARPQWPRPRDPTDAALGGVQAAPSLAPAATAPTWRRCRYPSIQQRGTSRRCLARQKRACQR
jgi:hypothetical protein